MADLLYRQGTRDLVEVAELLSITKATAEKYVADARRDEKAEQKTRAWDSWLDCESYRDIAEQIGTDHKTISAWCGEKANEFGNSPPDSRQHFDVWSFGNAPDDVGTQSYFGKMPAQIVENLLWLYTEPGQIVFDPFAGGGTTIDVAKAMGRRVWSSDRKPSTPTLPIHEWDITNGWPTDAPNKVDFTLLDPPYWKQAAGRYSQDADDLGNMKLDEFMAAWETVVKTVAEHSTGHIAYIISPTQTDDGVVDHAFEMYRTCLDLGLKPERRIIVTYNTQQATGQQVTWARENRRCRELPVNGHNPDGQLSRTWVLVEFKTTGGRNLAIETNSLHAYEDLETYGEKAVYIIFAPGPQSAISDWRVTTRDELQLISGPHEPTGNGSNDPWYLFKPTGWEFEKAFPLR